MAQWYTILKIIGQERYQVVAAGHGVDEDVVLKTQDALYRLPKTQILVVASSRFSHFPEKGEIFTREQLEMDPIPSSKKTFLERASQARKRIKRGRPEPRPGYLF